MNIICPKQTVKDPFAQSDRDFQGPGKGDRDRSVRSKFNRGYENIAWPLRLRAPGKTVYRFPKKEAK